MDRLGFFKQGLSSVFEAAQTVVGLKKAAETFTEAVDDALRDIAPEIGLYLPSLDAAMYDSPSGTLYEVGQMGYKQVEAGCYYNGTAYGVEGEELHKMARSSGLKIVGLHLNKFYEKEAPTDGAESSAEGVAKSADDVADTTDAAVSAESVSDAVEPILSEECREWWKKALKTALAMQCERVVMSQLPEEMTLPMATEYARYFEAVATMAAEQGLKFCFHPMHQALRRVGEVSLFEEIAQQSRQVRFVIDTFEAQQADVDVCELLRGYRERIVALHLHDYGIVGESGRIDFNKVVREASQCDIHDLVVEVSSFPLPPQNCVEHSLQNVEMFDGLNF